MHWRFCHVDARVEWLSPTGLDAKSRDLIALAVAISLGCDGCIAVHTEAARKQAPRKKGLQKPWE
jgi:AhpD family alkylhydroperoxidase